MSNDRDPPFERLQFFAQRHQPLRMPIAHWHSQIELNYLSSGQMTYLINGQLVPLVARRMGAFWGATPHQVVAQEGEADLVVIYLPLGEFLGLSLPHDFRRRLMGGGFLMDRNEDPADRFLFRRWYDDLQADRQDLKDLVRNEIACRLWRLALTGYELVRGIDVVAKPGVATTDASLEHVRDMAVFIARNFARSLTVDEIAQAADIHPNYAMTLFRRVIGMTISEYLTRQRLSRVQSMLIDTDLPVAEIAEKNGFSSLSRFYEAFRQWVGKKPSRYRSELLEATYGPYRRPPSNRGRYPAGPPVPAARIAPKP